MKLVDFIPNFQPRDRWDGFYPRIGGMVGSKVVQIGNNKSGRLDKLIIYSDYAGEFDRIHTRDKQIEGIQGFLKEVGAGHDVEEELKLRRLRILDLNEVKVCAPLAEPISLRDFYAFEQHVKTANKNRGRNVPKEWYEFPVFYFSNNTAIYGPEDVIPYPSYTDALDYELEVACVIGKPGRDIPAEKAEEYIFGYMIFNDWSARDVQRREMAVGLGPAKGKDFANSFGPYLVTPDELADRHVGRPGVYDLDMVARVNGVERSRGNWKDLYWSFGQMIERASQDVTLQPGEVIGSGTVGTGCLLEITKGEGPWLQPGDMVELEIERLGVLRNKVGEKPNRSDVRDSE